MADDFDKELSKEYCPRFGKIAIDMGFITADQLKEAIAEQIDDDLANRPHRLIGTVLFEKGWITYQQIEQVMSKLFKK